MTSSSRSVALSPSGEIGLDRAEAQGVTEALELGLVAAGVGLVDRFRPRVDDHSLHGRLAARAR